MVGSSEGAGLEGGGGEDMRTAGVSEVRGEGMADACRVGLELSSGDGLR